MFRIYIYREVHKERYLNYEYICFDMRIIEQYTKVTSCI